MGPWTGKDARRLRTDRPEWLIVFCAISLVAQAGVVFYLRSLPVPRLQEKRGEIEVTLEPGRAPAQPEPEARAERPAKPAVAPRRTAARIRRPGRAVRAARATPPAPPPARTAAARPASRPPERIAQRPPAPATPVVPEESPTLSELPGTPALAPRVRQAAPAPAPAAAAGPERVSSPQPADEPGVTVAGPVSAPAAGAAPRRIASASTLPSNPLTQVTAAETPRLAFETVSRSGPARLSPGGRPDALAGSPGPATAAPGPAQPATPDRSAIRTAGAGGDAGVDPNGNLPRLPGGRLFASVKNPLAQEAVPDERPALVVEPGGAAGRAAAPRLLQGRPAPGSGGGAGGGSGPGDGTTVPAAPEVPGIASGRGGLGGLDVPAGPGGAGAGPSLRRGGNPLAGLGGREKPGVSPGGEGGRGGPGGIGPGGIGPGGPGADGGGGAVPGLRGIPFLRDLSADTPGGNELPRPGGALPGPGMHVVYVVDASWSMREHNKIEKVRAALKRALAELKPEDSFNVIDFSGNVRGFAAGMVPATAENVEQAGVYLDRIQLRSQTDVLQALERALSLKPITHLVLLSDGDSSVGTIEKKLIRSGTHAANGQQARLMTFSLGRGVSDSGKRLLRELAEDSGGEYHALRLER